MHKKVERAKKRELEILYSLISHKLDILVEKAFLSSNKLFFRVQASKVAKLD